MKEEGKEIAADKLTSSFPLFVSAVLIVISNAGNYINYSSRALLITLDLTEVYYPTSLMQDDSLLLEKNKLQSQSLVLIFNLHLFAFDELPLNKFRFSNPESFSQTLSFRNCDYL